MTRSPIPPPPATVVVMGVSGSGKSTVGAALAERLGVAFVDADGLHPPANVATMRAGIPLTDADRLPWLDAVGAALAAHADQGVVVACSALRRTYRDRLRTHAPGVVFLHLAGARDLLTDRMSHRGDHFMPTGLLDSQLDTLEPLAADEPGATVDILRPVTDLVDAATAALARPARTAGQEDPR